MIEALYDAAASAGLLVLAVSPEDEAMVDFKMPDDDILDGLGISRGYAIRYPASRLPSLSAGSQISIAGAAYRVREVTLLSDGSEARATLSRL